MAAPCCKWISVVVLVFLICYSVIATSDDTSGKSNNLWELPILETECDSVTPVCGEGGIRFESACHAIAAGVRIVENDACLQAKKTSSCNVRCFRADPVCGVDGVTYWCGVAEAKCANVEVAYTSFCDLKSGGPGEKGNRAAQSLFLVNLVWLALAGFLVIAGFPYFVLWDITKAKYLGGSQKRNKESDEKRKNGQGFSSRKRYELQATRSTTSASESSQTWWEGLWSSLSLLNTFAGFAAAWSLANL